MKKAYIIYIEEIVVPDRGFLEGGWYSGRQYSKGKLGEPGVIVTNNKKGFSKIMTASEKAALVKKLFNSKFFK